MKRKEFVYEDENYDFFTSSKDDFVLDKNFKYIHTNIFYKAFRKSHIRNTILEVYQGRSLS